MVAEGLSAQLGLPVGLPGIPTPIPQETETHSFYLYYYKIGRLAGAQREKRLKIGRFKQKSGVFTGRPTNKQGKEE